MGETRRWELHKCQHFTACLRKRSAVAIFEAIGEGSMAMHERRLHDRGRLGSEYTGGVKEFVAR